MPAEDDPTDKPNNTPAVDAAGEHLEVDRVDEEVVEKAGELAVEDTVEEPSKIEALRNKILIHVAKKAGKIILKKTIKRITARPSAKEKPSEIKDHDIKDSPPEPLPAKDEEDHTPEDPTAGTDETGRTDEVILDLGDRRRYFLYGDVLGGDKLKASVETLAKSPNAQKYAEALGHLSAEFGMREIYEVAGRLRDECLAELQAAGIEPSVYAASRSWAYWDIAKQYYMLKHPDETTDTYRPGLANPLEDSPEGRDKLREIINRHIGWEAEQAYYRGDLKDVSPAMQSILALAKTDRAGLKSLSSYNLALLGEALHDKPDTPPDDGDEPGEADLDPDEDDPTTVDAKAAREKELRSILSSRDIATADKYGIPLLTVWQAEKHGYGVDALVKFMHNPEHRAQLKEHFGLELGEPTISTPPILTPELTSKAEDNGLPLEAVKKALDLGIADPIDYLVRAKNDKTKVEQLKRLYDIDLDPPKVHATDADTTVGHPYWDMNRQGQERGARIVEKTNQIGSNAGKTKRELKRVTLAIPIVRGFQQRHLSNLMFKHFKATRPTVTDNGQPILYDDGWFGQGRKKKKIYREFIKQIDRDIGVAKGKLSFHSRHELKALRSDRRTMAESILALSSLREAILNGQILPEDYYDHRRFDDALKDYTKRH